MERLTVFSLIRPHRCSRGPRGLGEDCGGVGGGGVAHSRPEVSLTFYLGCCQGDFSTFLSLSLPLREILANHTKVTWKKLISNITEI